VWCLMQKDLPRPGQQLLLAHNLRSKTICEYSVKGDFGGKKDNYCIILSDLVKYYRFCKEGGHCNGHRTKKIDRTVVPGNVR
jgi:hypothetical protein